MTPLADKTVHMLVHRLVVYLPAQHKLHISLTAREMAGLLRPGMHANRRFLSVILVQHDWTDDQVCIKIALLQLSVSVPGPLTSRLHAREAGSHTGPPAWGLQAAQRPCSPREVPSPVLSWGLAGPTGVV